MSIYVTGDIHGSADNIRNTVSQIKNPSAEDIIIIAGDASFEYEQYVMGSAKREARKFPGTWIVLRGNHDSRYWNHINDKNWEVIQYQNCDYLRQKKYPNIWYLPDEGCIYRLNDYNILFIPGAYSVDKWYRLRNNYPWNPAEQLTKTEMDNLKLLTQEWIDLGFGIDFVIGHTFPLKMQHCYQDLFMTGLDQTTVDKTMERWLDEMADLYEFTDNFKQYFGGHFHDDRIIHCWYTMLYHDVVNLADYEEKGYN